MLPIICLTRSFEGKPLPFFTRDGTLATVARHLGARLGLVTLDPGEELHLGNIAIGIVLEIPQAFQKISCF